MPMLINIITLLLSIYHILFYLFFPTAGLILPSPLGTPLDHCRISPFVGLTPAPERLDRLPLPPPPPPFYPYISLHPNSAAVAAAMATHHALHPMLLFQHHLAALHASLNSTSSSLLGNSLHGLSGIISTSSPTPAVSNPSQNSLITSISRRDSSSSGISHGAALHNAIRTASTTPTVQPTSPTSNSSSPNSACGFRPSKNTSIADLRLKARQHLASLGI